MRNLSAILQNASFLSAFSLSMVVRHLLTDPAAAVNLSRNVLFAPVFQMSILARMRLVLTLRFSLFLALTALVEPGLAALGADSLNWRMRQNRVDARIDSMDLQVLLGKVSAATGWIVYMEPDTTRQVSVKFQNTSSGEA